MAKSRVSHLHALEEWPVRCTILGDFLTSRDGAGEISPHLLPRLKQNFSPICLLFLWVSKALRSLWKKICNYFVFLLSPTTLPLLHSVWSQEAMAATSPS